MDESHWFQTDEYETHYCLIVRCALDISLEFFSLSLALSPGFPEVPDSGIRFPPDMPRNAGSQRSMRRERHTLQAAFIVSSIADSSFFSPRSL